MFAFALTACTIVPIAARPAKFGPPTPMSADSPTSLVACTLTNDKRLITGACAIPLHVARHAGHSEKVQEELAAATASACREIFSLAPTGRNSKAGAKLSVATFSDRVEVTLELSPGLGVASKGRSKPAAKGTARRNRKPLAGLPVDQAQWEFRHGRPCITLVKYGLAVKSKSKL